MKYDLTSLSNADTSMDWNEPILDEDATPASTESTSTHGSTAAGALACCRRSQRVENAVVDCASCLEQSWSALKLSLSNEELAIAERLLSGLRRRGKEGNAKAELMVRSDGAHSGLRLTVFINRIWTWTSNCCRTLSKRWLMRTYPSCTGLDTPSFCSCRLSTPQRGRWWFTTRHYLEYCPGGGSASTARKFATIGKQPNGLLWH